MSGERLNVARNENDDDELLGLSLVFFPNRKLPPGDPDRPSMSTPREDKSPFSRTAGREGPE